MPEILASTYEILQKIGAGGGGEVYLAYHQRLGKKVVLKADKRSLSTRADLLRREADVLKNLNHPYIPKVYDIFVENETVYTVIDYIEGESLDRPLKRGGLSNRRLAHSRLLDETQERKLFDVLAERYAGREGGYTRIIKAGIRASDAAPIAIIELVDRDMSAKGQDSGPVQGGDEEFDEAA